MEMWHLRLLGAERDEDVEALQVIERKTMHAKEERQAAADDLDVFQKLIEAWNAAKLRLTGQGGEQGAAAQRPAGDVTMTESRRRSWP